MKKTLLTLFVSTAFLTACDQNVQTQSTQSAAPAAQSAAPAAQTAPAQQAAPVIDYKQVAQEKAEKAKAAAEVAKTKAAQANENLKLMTQKYDEAKAILAQGGEQAQQLADQKTAEGNVFQQQVIKLSQEAQEAAKQADGFAKEADAASQQSHAKAK
ncbi:hypothetical protein O3886_07620 [Haemophilus sputorum]|uniref:hypothetical protein n=1 Tax=Haemophilus sputorum TaxID=1078480 RepID=UPI002102E46D|nr:hypothetical protein [Haemophilus sputorum]MCQ1857791.1 hypothetical protein [Haemophilus sputorum]